MGGPKGVVRTAWLLACLEGATLFVRRQRGGPCLIGSVLRELASWPRNTGAAAPATCTHTYMQPLFYLLSEPCLDPPPPSVLSSTPAVTVGFPSLLRLCKGWWSAAWREAGATPWRRTARGTSTHGDGTRWGVLREGAAGGRGAGSVASGWARPRGSRSATVGSLMLHQQCINNPGRPARLVRTHAWHMPVHTSTSARRCPARWL